MFPARCTARQLRGPRRRLRCLALVLCQAAALLLTGLEASRSGFVAWHSRPLACRIVGVARRVKVGEEEEEKVTQEEPPPAPRDNSLKQLDTVVQHVYRPSPEEAGRVLAWEVETQLLEGGNKSYLASVTIVPSNLTFRGTWQATAKAARQRAAAKALQTRIGDAAQLGNPRNVLTEVLTALFHDSAISEPLTVTSQELSPSSFEAEARLPLELFGPEALPEEAISTGSGATKKEAERSAVEAALVYFCGLLTVLQPLKLLVDKLQAKTTKTLNLHSPRIDFKNVNPATSERELREYFEQFGSIKKFDLKYRRDGRSFGRGSVTFAQPLSAWITQRMLNRALVDDHVLLLELSEPPVKARNEAGSQMSYGKQSSPEAVLFYRNAPIRESFQSMLDTFKQFGEVASFRYWVDEKTGSSRGMGTICYGSAEASGRALEKLREFEISGRKLQVDFYQKHSQADTGVLASTSVASQA